MPKVYSSSLEPITTQNIQAYAPIETRLVVDSRADLTSATTWNNGTQYIYLYSGIRVTVINDSVENNNGVYFLPKRNQYNKQSWDPTDTSTYNAKGWHKLYDNTTPISSGTTLTTVGVDYTLGQGVTNPWGVIMNDTLSLHLDPGVALNIEYDNQIYPVYKPLQANNSLGNFLTIGDHLMFTDSESSTTVNRIEAEFISEINYMTASDLYTWVVSNPGLLKYPAENTISPNTNIYIVIDTTFGNRYACDVSMLQSSSAGVNTLAQLLDTTISNPSAGQYLIYQNGYWVNSNPPTIPTINGTGSNGYLTSITIGSNTYSIPSVVSGVHDNTNWTSLTIGSDTYSIPAAGGSQSQSSVFICHYENSLKKMYDQDGLQELTQTDIWAEIGQRKAILCEDNEGSMYYLSNAWNIYPPIPITFTSVSYKNSFCQIRYIFADAQSLTGWSHGDTTNQVNADWNATSGVAEILNKPTIPTVPTNVSYFTNDAGYITTAKVLVCTYSDNSGMDTSAADIISAYNNGYVVLCKYRETVYYLQNCQYIQNASTCVIRFVSVVYVSLQNTFNYSEFLCTDLATWTMSSYNIGSGGSGTVTIPTNVSAFTNDAGYITNADIPASQTLSVSTGTIISGTLDESYTSSLYLSGDGSPVIFEGMSPESNGTGTDIRLVTTTETLGANPHDNILFKINTIDGGILTLTQEPTDILFPRVRSFSSSDTPSDVFTDNHIALKYGSPLVFSGMLYDDAGTYTGYNHMFCVGDTMQNNGNTTSALDPMLFHVGPYYGGTGISVQNNPSDMELGRIDLNVEAGSNITLSTGNNGSTVISATIPTNVSELTNDADYITSSNTSLVAEMANSELWSFYTGATNQGIVITASERMQCILFDNTGGRDAIPISFAADTGYTLDFIYSPNSEATVSVPSGSRKLLKVRFVNSNTLYYELIDLYSHHPSI